MPTDRSPRGSKAPMPWGGLLAMLLLPLLACTSSRTPRSGGEGDRQGEHEWRSARSSRWRPQRSGGPAGTSEQEGSGASLPRDSAGPRQPNIIWIVADDMGYADAGFQGSTVFQTPALDQLARGGVIVRAGYTSASVCSPSRAGLLTGRYQQRFGHEQNLPPELDHGLPRGERTIAEALGEAGYSTGIVGKWHLGARAGQEPSRHGFDHFYGLLGGSRGYFPRDRIASHQEIRRNGVLERDRPGSYLTERLGSEARDFVLEAREPFFLYLPFTAPHTPLEARSSQRARFVGLEEDRATLAAMTLAMDEAIGSVLEALDRRGIAEHTMVAFLSDNGGARANSASNAPLRDFKGSPYEGGIRVPFLLRWPRELGAGLELDERHAVSALDLFPTSCAAAGITAGTATGGSDGVNLLPLLRGDPAPLRERTLYWRRRGTRAVRHREWKLVDDGERVELFDLAADTAERRDLARMRPGVVRQLLDLHRDWSEGLPAPAWDLDDLR